MDLFLGRSDQHLLAWANDDVKTPGTTVSSAAAALSPDETSLYRWQPSAAAAAEQKQDSWHQWNADSWQPWAAQDSQQGQAADTSQWDSSAAVGSSGDSWGNDTWQAVSAATSQAAAADSSQAVTAEQPKKVKRPGKNKERGGKHKLWYRAYWGAIQAGKSAKEATDIANYEEL